MDTHTRRSHGGYINFVNDGTVRWKNGLQSIVTLSRCEAEYIALCSKVCQVRYLRSLLRSLGNKQRDSTVIWEDNRSTTENIVRVRYTPTETNLEDILTKTLSRATFDRVCVMCHGNKLGNY
jgi:hypothetical protein